MTTRSPGNEYIFNVYLPWLRQQGMARPGIREQLPAPPPMPTLPTYDMDYMRQQGDPSRAVTGFPTPPMPPIDVRIPPPFDMGPAETRTVQPPEPVDWGQRIGDIRKGAESFVTKVPGGVGRNMFEQFLDMKSELNEYDEAGVPPSKGIEFPWGIGGIGGRAVDFGKRFGSLFKDEAQGWQSLEETWHPMLGAVHSQSWLPSPVLGGTVPNPWYHEETDLYRKAIRNTVNPRTGERYGPAESLSSAYDQSDIPEWKKISAQIVFDPLNIPVLKGLGAARAGLRGIKALGRETAQEVVPEIGARSIPTRANRYWTGDPVPEEPVMNQLWREESLRRGGIPNQYWREGEIPPPPPTSIEPGIPTRANRYWTGDTLPEEPVMNPLWREESLRRGGIPNQLWREGGVTPPPPVEPGIPTRANRYWSGDPVPGEPNMNQLWREQSLARGGIGNELWRRGGARQLIDETVPDVPPSVPDVRPSPAAAVTKIRVPATRLVEAYVDGNVVPRTPEGNAPEILYRAMDRQQYDDAVERGVLEAAPGGDRRIYASGEPRLQFIDDPSRPVVIVAIDYSDADGWTARWASTAADGTDEVSAVTSNPIPISKVSIVAEGNNRRQLTDNLNALQRGLEPTPAAAAPSPADAVPTPGRPAADEIVTGREGNIDEVISREIDEAPDPMDMDRAAQQEQVRTIGDGGGHDKARDIVQDDAVREAVDSGSSRMSDIDKGRNLIGSAASKITGMAKSNSSAEAYVRTSAKIHDNNFALRRLLDYMAKTGDSSVNPHKAWEPGGDLDALSAISLSEGPMARAVYKMENLMKMHIEPLLVKQAGDILEGGIEARHISKLLIARHYKSLLDNPKTRFTRDNLPNPVDNEGNLIDDTVDVLEWESHMKGRMSEAEFSRVEKGAEHIRDLYIKERDNLLKSGILEPETVKELAEEYPWYNPIVYIEFLEQKGTIGTLGGTASPYSNTGTGLYSFAKAKEFNAILGALDPLDPEVMLRQLAQNEFRIKRNTVSKMIHGIVEQEGRLGWLRDITKEFQETVLVDGKSVTRNKPIPFSDDAGYISFYENGQRRVFGGVPRVTAEGQVLKRAGLPEPIQKDLYDIIYGKGGLASRGTYELENFWGWAANIRRGTLTTYNPLFMFKNGILDMFTVWLKRGVMPPGVINQMVRNFDGIVNEADNALVDIARTAGFYQSRTTNISSYTQGLQSKINKAGFDGDVIWASDMTKSMKIRHKLHEAFDNGFVKPKIKKAGQKWSRTAQVVEQAARLEVAERTIIARLGAGEWNRLKKLPREEFIEELLYSYRGTPGKGLADHPAIREAGMASLEATVNFWRGGQWIRRINPITYFMNAAMEGSKLPFRAIGVNIHPNIRPVENPVAGGPHWEYGKYKEGLKRGATGTYEELDITRRTTKRARGRWLKEELTGNEVLDDMRMKYNTDTIPMMEFVRTAFTGKGLSSANGAMVRMAGVLSAQTTVMGWNLMHADEWGYWDIPGWVKYSGFLILLPPKRDENGEYIIDPATGRVKPNYLVIPHRTREWSILTAFPQYVLERIAQSFDKSAEGKTSFKQFVHGLISEMTPADNLPIFGGEAGISSVLKPFVGAREIAEELQGRDFWREEPIVPDTLQYRDKSDQYLPYTSETIRRISNILPENSTYASPLRLDHLATSIYGGTGQVATSVPDWILGTIDGIHRKGQMLERRTPEGQAQYYRSLKSRSERVAYKASVARNGMEALQDFEDALRKPVRELSSIPFVSDLMRSYNPPYTGGIREIGERQQEAWQQEEGFDFDKDRTNELRATFNRIRKMNYGAQQEDDRELQLWAHRKVGDDLVGISPSQWKGRRSERNNNYDFFEKVMIDIHGEDTVYARTPEEKEHYYSLLYKMATKVGVQDIRAQGEILIAGYFNIRYPEGKDPDLEQINSFYRDRDLYVEGLKNTFGENSAEFKEFEMLRQANMTEIERRYDSARIIMSPYFDIGSTADTFMPRASQEQKELWNAYMLSEGQEREGFEQMPIIDIFRGRRDMERRNYVLRSIDSNGESNLDMALVFWYGDGYYSNKSLTKLGRDYQSHLHGPISPTRQPAMSR